MILIRTSQLLLLLVFSATPFLVHTAEVKIYRKPIPQYSINMELVPPIVISAVLAIPFATLAWVIKFYLKNQSSSKFIASWALGIYGVVGSIGLIGLFNDVLHQQKLMNWWQSHVQEPLITITSQGIAFEYTKDDGVSETFFPWQSFINYRVVKQKRTTIIDGRETSCSSHFIVLQLEPEKYLTINLNVLLMDHETEENLKTLSQQFVESGVPHADLLSEFLKYKFCERPTNTWYFWPQLTEEDRLL